MFTVNGIIAPIDKFSDSGPTANAWNFAALSVNENGGATGGFFYLNGAYSQVASSDTFNPNYSSSAASATEPVRIGRRGNQEADATGHRVDIVAAWEGTVLSKANLDSIYNDTKGRYGL